MCALLRVRLPCCQWRRWHLQLQARGLWLHLRMEMLLLLLLLVSLLLLAAKELLEGHLLSTEGIPAGKGRRCVASWEHQCRWQQQVCPNWAVIRALAFRPGIAGHKPG